MFYYFKISKLKKLFLLSVVIVFVVCFQDSQIFFNFRIFTFPMTVNIKWW